MYKFIFVWVYLCLVLLSVGLFSNQTLAKGTDPTRPLTGSNASGSIESLVPEQIKLELQSIIEQGQQRKAIINDKILKKGDHVGAYQVMKINRKNVILKSAERRLTLSVFTKVLSK